MAIIFSINQSPVKKLSEKSNENDNKKHNFQMPFFCHKTDCFVWVIPWNLKIFSYHYIRKKRGSKFSQSRKWNWEMFGIFCLKNDVKSLVNQNITDYFSVD